VLYTSCMHEYVRCTVVVERRVNTIRYRGGWGGRYSIHIQNEYNEFMSGRIKGSIK
jgi:hypothetical protein